MKVGPVHVIRDATFRKLHELQDLWHHFSSRLAAEAKDGNPLADRVLEHTHGLLHSPLGAQFAPGWVPEPLAADDESGNAAAARVAAAYRKAVAAAPDRPSRSMWDDIAGGKRAFFAALKRDDIPAVRVELDRMFRTDLTWGLGQVHSSHPDLLRSPTETHLHYRFTDTLVSLAEAVGAARLTSMQQDPPDHLRPLHVNTDAVYAATAARLGFDPAFPHVGGAYGFRCGDAMSTIDALTHAYTAYRVRELGGVGNTVYELGGGYGCLALMARRAGVANYAVYDLPWVNALQGYFLLRSLPAGTVRLFGESDGALAVLPYWELYSAPAASCDVFVNTDSLPEMGHATATAYLPHVHRVTRGVFLSINQEAKGSVPGVGEQNCVRELVEEFGQFAVRSRQRHWMRAGYVEEVFAPRG